MLPRHDEPMVAIATPPGRGAVGIVRASGSDLTRLARALLDRDLAPRVATLVAVRDSAGAVIDQGLAIYFPAPVSYTGEDVLELQAHGGPVVLQLLLARVLEAGAGLGLRLARPGEFTERAFMNDKLDLVQAESVADLIDASTEAAARSASRSLSGALSHEVTSLGEALLSLRTLVEATLDFPEEEIDFLRAADASGQLDDVRAGLSLLQARTRQGALLREGLNVALIGQPNVGKSSLLNALAGAELAIVTPIAGTTRDRVRESIQIQGVPIHLVDTAGLRDTSDDEVERIGMARSWEVIHHADVVIFLHDLTRAGDADYQAAEARISARLEPLSQHATRVLDVYNKSDLVKAPAGVLAVCARSGEGLEALRSALLERAGWRAEPEGVFIARARHVDALDRCARHLQAGADWLAAREPAFEMLAEELRLAHRALGEIVGQVTSDDLLGQIFSRFCIGK
jgi:tRNA modification GTPase